MTRETKIGLLVGLAFIIVTGILLSDVVTRQSEVPAANISVVGNDVRQGTGLFRSNNPPAEAHAPNPTPDQQVPSREETVHHGGVMDISIGNGGTGPAPVSAPRVQRQDTSGGGGGAAATDDSQPQKNVVSLADDARQRAAQSLGQELVPAGPPGHTEADYVADRTGPSPSRVASAARGIAAEGQQVQAAPGDSLSRLAAKYMGANTKANRDAIAKANSSLQQDPNKIIAGRTYVIPAAPAPTGAVATDSTAPPVPTPILPTPPVVTDTGSGNWYVVQPGDSLIRIATDQLGDPNAYVAIKELNKETLKGSDVVKPNMKLRLPSKPVAVAQ
jgi:nucleoid-associated protein YgaU